MPDGPSRWRVIAWVCSFVAAAVALALATRFDLDAFDSAELALVAVTRGLGHPPGQPTHTLLGWLITRGPWRPLAALAWLSIVPAAAMFALAIDHGAREGAHVVRLGHALACAAIAGVVCTLEPVRESVCRVEVYALGAAFAVGAVLVATRRNTRSDFYSGALIGLAAATNPVLGIQGMGAAWVALRGDGKIRWSALARMFVGGVVGLGAHLYDWAVAGRVRETIVWAAPHDWRSLYAQLSGQDFVQNRAVTLHTLAANLLRIPLDLFKSGTLPFVLLGALGMYEGARATPRARWSPLALPFAIAVAAGVLLVAVNVPYRPANPDYGGYYLAPIALACVGIARMAQSRFRLRLASVAVVAIASVSVYSAIDRGRPSGATRALATDVLTHAPANAIVVLASDHLFFPALYMQRVESLRPDVTLLNPGWGSSRWAWEYTMAHDRALVVDLTPGRGRSSRLVDAVRTRAQGRAVISESLALLADAAPGRACPRGFLWSSHEACVGSARGEIDRGTRLLREQYSFARRDSWDERMVWYNAREFGDQALALGCPNLALDYYRAAIGVVAFHNGSTAICDGRRVAPLPAAGLLEITREDVLAAIRATSTTERNE